MAKRFKGHLAPLLRHPTGAAVVDELYARATPRARDGMAAEFYSREYALLGGPPPASLAAALAAADAPARRATLARLAASLTPIVDKGMLDPVLVHRLLADYYAVAPRAATADLTTALSSPALLRAVHTPHGARLAVAVLARGSAKDRKLLVRALKGHVPTVARDEWACAALAACLAVVDDTALLAKVVVPELAAAAGDLAADAHGKGVLLSLISPAAPGALAPHVAALVKDAVDYAYGEGDGGPTSKKEPSARRRELAAALGGPLLAALADAAPALAASPSVDLLLEAARGGGDGKCAVWG